MEFRIQVRKDDSGTVDWETYTKNIEDPQAWAEQTLESFNNTLREGESSRTLLAVEILDEVTKIHIWEKTNMVTIINQHGNYDKMKCKNCKATAKRFGLGGVTMDSKFAKYKKWNLCQGVQ